MGAKQVHVFDRTADETISWIQEKGGLRAAEDHGHDLDTIQTLIQKHQGFEADLAAVKEQVTTCLTTTTNNKKKLTIIYILFIFYYYSPGGMRCTRSWSVVSHVSRCQRSHRSKTRRSS